MVVYITAYQYSEWMEEEKSRMDFTESKTMMQPLSGNRYINMYRKRLDDIREILKTHLVVNGKFLDVGCGDGVTTVMVDSGTEPIYQSVMVPFVDGSDPQDSGYEIDLVAGGDDCATDAFFRTVEIAFV